LTPSFEDEKAPVYFLGQKLPSKFEWSTIKEELRASTKVQLNSQRNFSEFSPSQKLNEKVSPLVTVIVSLYSSEDYLDYFLENLESQSLFDRVEVFIEVACASEVEIDTLSRFAEQHSNTKVAFHSERVGIYECWNLAIEKGSAPYITNMNCDDLRHPRSLEVQVSALLDEDTDVVYQDVYYSYEARLTWDAVVSIGIKSKLPPVTSELLISGLNPPHNAPMWKRDLHSRVGIFDTHFNSAGDHDFWIRCSLNGAKFLKTSHSTVIYYINPEGMSTRKNSPGAREGLEILEKYRKAGDAGL
jgi:glycosyltransferase involved in cell wall biosynthesis